MSYREGAQRLAALATAFVLQRSLDLQLGARADGQKRAATLSLTPGLDLPATAASVAPANFLQVDVKGFKTSRHVSNDHLARDASQKSRKRHMTRAVSAMWIHLKNAECPRALWRRELSDNLQPNQD